MNNFGKIVFYNNEEYCQITINGTDEKSFYRFNECDSIKLWDALQNYSDIISLKPNGNIKGAFFEKEEQLNLILKICHDKKLIPKKMNPKVRRRNKYVGMSIGVISAALLSFLIFKYNQENTSKISNENKYSSILNTEDENKHLYPYFKDETQTKKENNDFEKEYQTIEESDNVEKETKTEQDSHKEESLSISAQNIDEIDPSTQENVTQTSNIQNTFNLNDAELTNGEYEKYQNTVSMYYDLFEKYGKMYGIDPKLLSYIATQERGIHCDTMDANGAIGLFQIQVGCNELNLIGQEYSQEEIESYIKEKTITCYNFNMNQYEKIVPIEKNALSKLKNKNVLDGISAVQLSEVEDNVKTASAYLGHCLEVFSGDIITATIAYNQGIQATNNYIKQCRDCLGISYQEAKKSRKWIQYIPDDYGDKDYIYHVLRYAIANEEDSITCNYKDEEGNTLETFLTITGKNITKKVRSK